MKGRQAREEKKNKTKTRYISGWEVLAYSQNSRSTEGLRTRLPLARPSPGLNPGERTLGRPGETKASGLEVKGKQVAAKSHDSQRARPGPGPGSRGAGG